MSLVGNQGSPILKLKIDKLLAEYKLIRRTFISNNIFLVDNNKVIENNRNHRKYETKTYTHDVGLTINEEDIIDTPLGDLIAVNAANEQNKILDLNNTDADPENLDDGMVDSNDMKDQIKSDQTTQSSSTDNKVDTYNNSDYVDKDAGLEDESADSEADCEDFKDGINYNTKISKNYTLGQVSSNAVVSKYAIVKQKGLSPKQIACNLKNLATDVLDKIKDKYPSMIVTSGFRQGNGSSQHYKGEAADMQFFGGGLSNKDYIEISKWIKTNVPHDQLLLEYKNTGTKNAWIHISYSKSNRSMNLTLFNDSKKKPGSSGLVDLSGSHGIPV